MEEISLHILDIVENSVRSGAERVEIRIEEDPQKDKLSITIRDDGHGIDDLMQGKEIDPFFTTKEGKRVGLGLPLLAQATRRAAGEMMVRRLPEKGSEVIATFQHSHIDRQPLGDVTETMLALIVGNAGVEFLYEFQGPEGAVALDTADLRKALGDVSICSSEGIALIRKALQVRRGDSGG